MAAAFGKFSEKEGDGAPASGRPSTTIVGRGTELVGDLTGSGQVRVEGRVDGTIRVDGEVQVADDGSVEGRIEADEVVAAGRISGTVAARDAVRLEDGCRVDADVFCPVLELQEGGVLNGRVDMSGEGLPEPEAPVPGSAAPAAPEGDAGEESPAEAAEAVEEAVPADDGDDAEAPDREDRQA